MSHKVEGVGHTSHAHKSKGGGHASQASQADQGSQSSDLKELAEEFKKDTDEKREHIKKAGDAVVGKAAS